MERREDDPQGDGRSDAGRGACTSDGEQVNWLGMGVRGSGQAAYPTSQNRDVGHPSASCGGREWHELRIGNNNKS
jgi:hypothetical protein